MAVSIMEDNSMCKVYLPQCGGKTTKLIGLAALAHCYIVCVDTERAQNIAGMAKRMGVKIPYPITFEELKRAPHIREVMVDDADDVLCALLGREVLAMTFTVN